MLFLSLLILATAWVYSHSVIFLRIVLIWCLVGLLANRWMLSPAQEIHKPAWPLWFWLLNDCRAWPVRVVCGLMLRMRTAESVETNS